MGVVVSPDDKRIYVANGRGGTVSVIDAATKAAGFGYKWDEKSNQFAHALMQCLAKEPDRRPASTGALEVLLLGDPQDGERHAHVETPAPAEPRGVDQDAADQRARDAREPEHRAERHHPEDLADAGGELDAPTHHDFCMPGNPPVCSVASASARQWSMRARRAAACSRVMCP